MRRLEFCIFAVLILGASNQVWGRDEVGAKDTAVKIVNGVYNVIESVHNRVKKNINEHLVSLETNGDSCSLQKKKSIEGLKAQYEDVDLCFNVTQQIDKLENVINEGVNVILELGRDAVTILVNATHCLSNPDIFGCLANVTEELKTDLQQIIGDAGTVLSDLVDVILGCFINILECLQKPQSIQTKLDEITNSECQAEITNFH